MITLEVSAQLAKSSSIRSWTGSDDYHTCVLVYKAMQIIKQIYIPLWLIFYQIFFINNNDKSPHHCKKILSERVEKISKYFSCFFNKIIVGINAILDFNSKNAAKNIVLPPCISQFMDQFELCLERLNTVRENLEINPRWQRWTWVHIFNVTLGSAVQNDPKLSQVIENTSIATFTGSLKFKFANFATY